MKILAKKKKFVIFVFGLLLVVFLLNVFQKETRSFFYWFSAPIQKVLWGAGDRASDFFGAIIKIRSLKKETDELRQKNQELLSQIAALGELKKENQILRETLGIELQKEFNLILTEIISKDVSQDYILIDKGSDDGILENMSVITQEKVLVGKISEVYNNFSKVILISNKKISFDAKISASGGPAEGGQEEDISGLASGQGGYKISFEFIPREKNLIQGDIVITSVLGGVFPKGLLVGTIEEVVKSDLEPFQQVDIKPFFDISQTELLFIILEF